MKFQLIAAVDLQSKGLEFNEPHSQLDENGMLAIMRKTYDLPIVVAPEVEPIEALDATNLETEVETGGISEEVSPVSVLETEAEIKIKKGGRPPKKKTS
jgi:hypothetical protein